MTDGLPLWLAALLALFGLLGTGYGLHQRSQAQRARRDAKAGAAEADRKAAVSAAEARRSDDVAAAEAEADRAQNAELTGWLNAHGRKP